MKLSIAAVFAVAAVIAAPLALAQAPAGASTKDVSFYSEQVRIVGKQFLPPGFGPTSKAPAVVLAPGWKATAASLEPYAASLAQKGVVALVIDYRGWGRSGGFIYLAEDVRQEDRLRFSNHTPKVRIRRGRLDPQAQVQDIRNALTFLQGEPGVDRARLGVLGVDMAGGHAVAVSGMDARVKAAVAVTPRIPGKDAERLSYQPMPAQQAEMIRLARTGAAPAANAAARAINEAEARLALAEYAPFQLIAQIPETTAVLFVTAGADQAVDNAAHAAAAAAALKGPKEVTTIAGARHALTAAQTREAAEAAATFLAGKL